MFSSKIYKLIKLPIIFTTLGVLAFGFACTGMLNRQSMHAQADMNVTAVMPVDNQECCNTSISKHIESWKSTFLVLPREIKDGLLLLLIGLVTALAFVGLRFKHDPDNRERLSYRFYIRDDPELALFNQLKLAFARGILNPKIY